MPSCATGTGWPQAAARSPVRAQDGTEYADLWLVYASSEQIRKESALALQHPPVAVRLKLKGLQANKDQLYLLSDVEQRFSTAIAAYDAL